MAHKGSQTERRHAEEVTEEFIERDLLPETVENDVLRCLDSQEPVQALETALKHRKDRS